MVCKINTRTTIIGATNPLRTQKWDPNLDLLQNTGISSSLLSRFDLVFVMVDVHNPEDDTNKANYTLMRQCISSVRTHAREEQWEEERLREYINFIQKVFEPVVTEESETLLRAYY